MPATFGGISLSAGPNAPPPRRSAANVATRKGFARVGRGAAYVTASARRGPPATSSSTAPRSCERTSALFVAPAPTRASFTARRPLRVGPVHATYVAPRPSATGSTGAPRGSAPVGPQRRSSVRVRHLPAPSRTATPQERPTLPQVRTTRPLRTMRTDSRRLWIDVTCPKRTTRVQSPPAGRTRAASRVPARQASTRSPRALIATAAFLPTARSRGGPNACPAVRSATRMNGERSPVQATIASPAALASDQWLLTNSASTANGPKPPSDCPSAMTSRRRLVSERASRATSIARVVPYRWICALAGWTPSRSGARCQPPEGSREATPPKSGGTRPRSAPFQLSSARPCASNARSCSPTTPSEAAIGSSRHGAACAGAAATPPSSASAVASQRAENRRGEGASLMPGRQRYRPAREAVPWL